MLAKEAGSDTLHPDNPDIVITDHTPFSRKTPTIILSDGLNGPEALKTGASGILPHDVAASDLLLAMEAVIRGFIIMPRSAGGTDRDPASPDSSELPRDNMLTARELEVLRLLAEGASNKLIARRLGISFHTAKFHVASIAAKLDATGRTDAVAQAVRLGLILL
ncbi:helix-turn-helix transcriptional regulator [Microvirga sp. CF3016]|uniref:helix-turn-helix transcriptional regulator n=1 Tax=Microvirga sp. CF3016 TaxID=3110181 RepID=UPI002E773991|nr:response regulator transcription factor [Microvirga sp. CF3016]MEE1609917.1 response regulator transcription factor [Microvirga sp. CF3016]